MFARKWRQRAPGLFTSGRNWRWQSWILVSRFPSPCPRSSWRRPCPRWPHRTPRACRPANSSPRWWWRTVSHWCPGRRLPSTADLPQQNISIHVMHVKQNWQKPTFLQLNLTGQLSCNHKKLPSKGWSPQPTTISQLQKLNLTLFGQKRFQFLGHFRQLLWRNRLDITRCTTTGSGRLYGLGRIILVCNAYAVTIFAPFLGLISAAINVDKAVVYFVFLAKISLYQA